MKHQPRSPNKLFAETKMGIVTRHGDWFHITSDQIEDYAPGLLEHIELKELVKAAQAWVKSADSISMVLILVLLFVLNPYIAAAITLLFHFVWYLNKSSFVAKPLNSFFHILYQDGTQLIMALVAISVLGLQGFYTAGVVGLVFFFLLKLGLLKRVWDRIYYSLNGSGLSLNDRVMKMVIIKFAIWEDVAPEEIKKMEEDIKELATSRKKK